MLLGIQSFDKLGNKGEYRDNKGIQQKYNSSSVAHQTILSSTAQVTEPTDAEGTA
jgi:hypothetical protein